MQERDLSENLRRTASHVKFWRKGIQAGVCVSRSVVSDSLDCMRPCGLQPDRLLCPWDSPGKNTGVGCCCLLQGIFPTQGSNLGLLYGRQIFYHLSHQGSPFQAEGRANANVLGWNKFGDVLAQAGGSDGKASAYSVGDWGSVPGLGRSPGEGNGNPLQYSCLENPMDRGAWQATVHGVAKSQTGLSNFTLAQAAITKYHRLGGLNNKLFSQFWKKNV